MPNNDFLSKIYTLFSRFKDFLKLGYLFLNFYDYFDTIANVVGIEARRLLSY